MNYEKVNEKSGKVDLSSSVQPIEAMLVEWSGKEYPLRRDGETVHFTLEQAGNILDYPHPEKSVRKLISGHKDEFDNDCLVFADSANTPKTFTNSFLTLDGFALLCMHSHQPKAKPARKWATQLMVSVWTKGYCVSPNMTDSVIGPIMAELTSLMDSRIANLSALLISRTVPRDADVSELLTPAYRLRQLILPEVPPKGFNRGGAYDRFHGEECYRERGVYPRVRSRRFIGKLPECVVYSCPEDDNLLRRSYKKYLRAWSTKQRKLNLRVLNVRNHRLLLHKPREVNR